MICSVVPKSEQHRQAHSGKARASLYAVNSEDTASFINGVASSINVKQLKQYASGDKLRFYSVMETIRHINHQANTRFPGRRQDIKDARFANSSISDIYDAAINPRRASSLSDPLRHAIHEACKQPSFNDSLFQAAWDLWNETGDKNLSSPLPSSIKAPSNIPKVPPNTPLMPSLLQSLGDDLISNQYSAALEAAMRVTHTKRVQPEQTVVKELLHHTLLDIEAGMVIQERQILRAGMVVTSLASRLYRGRTDIFQRRIASYTGPLMAFIMDMSGSMSRYWPAALAIMGAVAHTLNRAGASTICVGFASNTDNNIIYQFQDAGETFDIDRFTMITPPDGNADATAVEYCRRQLLMMDSIEPKKKYIIVFSDESPAGMQYYNFSGNDVRTLNEVLTLCVSSNVRTISVLTGRDKAQTGIHYATRTVLKSPEETLDNILEIMGVQ